MDKIIDFTNCERVHTSYGGSDRKFGVVYNNETYMLKFSEKHAKKTDLSTSYVNNPIAEYISSHIIASTGLPVHETVLGLYKDEIVVGCKDFREPETVMVEFSEYVRATFESTDVKRTVLLQQIYDTIKNSENAFSEDFQKEIIQRYWDTMVVDALVGNFDRHIGNWGFLVKDNEPQLAPIYDLGSTLFPQLSDQGARECLQDKYKLYERALVFPSPALIVITEKAKKVGYYDLLSSNFDENCTKSVLRIAPKIEMDRVNDVLDNTPFLTEPKKEFYKEILKLRKEFIIDRAYLRCLQKNYDKEALSRIKAGRQFSIPDFENFVREQNKSCKIIFCDEIDR